MVSFYWGDEKETLLYNKNEENLNSLLSLIQLALINVYQLVKKKIHLVEPFDHMKEKKKYPPQGVSIH